MPRDSCRIVMKRYCFPGVTLSAVCSAHCPLMVFLDWAQMTGGLHLILLVLGTEVHSIVWSKTESSTGRVEQDYGKDKNKPERRDKGCIFYMCHTVSSVSQ